LIESFFTISHSATGSYKEKGSKFLAFAHPVTDSEQIRVKLDEIKKEYHDARHHCYAWVLGGDKSQFKTSDDGEPNHSAGDPILNQIKSKNLTNTLIVVVRYFGGVKLGVSGLTNAYKLAALSALENAVVVEITLTKSFSINYDYPETSIIKKLVNEFNLKIRNEKFNEVCLLEFDVKLSLAENLVTKIDRLALQGHKIRIH
jgi:uncharacterized YigZ family protein